MKAAICAPSAGNEQNDSASAISPIANSEHDDRGEGAADAEPLQPVDQRIEQIGERHADDERQQHVAEQPEQRDENDQRAEPEDELPLERQRRSRGLRGFRHLAHSLTAASVRADMADPFGDIEGDRQQRQDGDHRSSAAAGKPAIESNPSEARTRHANTIWATGIELRHQQRLHLHRAADQPGQHDRADDHDVARHHQDDEPARYRPAIPSVT